MFHLHLQVPCLCGDEWNWQMRRLQSPNYFQRPIFKGEFIKMDKNHPEASQVHQYQAGNSQYTICLQAYSKFQHRKQVGALENTLEVYLWQKLHQSTLILPPRYDEKRRKEIVTYSIRSSPEVD